VERETITRQKAPLVNENNYNNTTSAHSADHKGGFVEGSETFYCGKRKITFIDSCLQVSSLFYHLSLFLSVRK